MYDWSGMKKLTFEEVKEAYSDHYFNTVTLFFLYDDGTEAQYYDYKMEDIVEHYQNGGEFGVELDVCPECGKEVVKDEMISTIMLCKGCYAKLMAESNDSGYPTATDECTDNYFA